jgi:methionyl-tRNA formyltransferase
VAGEAAGARVLRVAEEAGCTFAGLVISDGERGERRAPNELYAAASRLGCPIWPAQSVRDPAFAEHVSREETDILVNVHSLYVICPEVLAAPRIGGFNLHPGPLPECPGLNAVSWALFEGKTEHAVTVHWMRQGIDTGPVAYEARIPITPHDTALTLSAKCVRAGVPLLERLLSMAAANPLTIPRIPQDLTRRRYRGREVPQNGRIDWSRGAKEIVGFVRACDYGPYPSPWGRPSASFGGREVSVLAASCTGISSTAPPGMVGETADRGMMVSARDQWVIVRRLSVHRRAVDPADFLTAGRRFDKADEQALNPTGGI